MKYANDCISNGKKMDVVITHRVPPIRDKAWYAYKAKTLEENVSFCSSEYYKKGEVVTCYVKKMKWLLLKEVNNVQEEMKY